MILESPQRLLTWLIVALLLDAVVGDPPWLWRRLPHPVVLLGRLVSYLERRLLADAMTPARKRRQGRLLVVICVAASSIGGLAIHLLTSRLAHGWLIEAAAGAVLLAQRSLADHVAAVANAFDQGLRPARAAVAAIVGRDPDRLDGHAIGRAAIESMAENFSDGVVAPLFWALILGLPGMFAYKAINTMDSMIGHKTQHYLDFGRSAARLDDLVNLPAARLSALLVMAAALVMPKADASCAWRVVRRDARRHRSPNAGWPEAAFAGALGIRLAGPRSYGGVASVGTWIGTGRAEVTSSDIRRGMDLLWLSWSAVMLMLAAALWWASA